MLRKINPAVHMMRTKYIMLFAGAIFLASCSGIPGHFTEKSVCPVLFPDITDITIPVNIAPLNFSLAGNAQKMVAVYECEKGKNIFHGKHAIEIPVGKWHKMLEKYSDKSMIVTLFSKEEGKWIKYLPFKINIKKATIDPWLVYRLI